MNKGTIERCREMPVVVSVTERLEKAEQCRPGRAVYAVDERALDDAPVEK